MKMETVKVRIFNPNREQDIEVPVFESLMEAIEAITSEGCLHIINKHNITVARSSARERIIKSLRNE